MKNWKKEDFGTEEQFEKFREAAFEVVPFDYENESVADQRDLVFQGMLKALDIVKEEK